MNGRADSRFLVGGITAPKDVPIQILRPKNMFPYIEKKDFADMVKDLNMSLIWVIMEGPI